MIDIIDVPTDDKFQIITEHQPDELRYRALVRPRLDSSHVECGADGSGQTSLLQGDCRATSR
jgi:hypothetical protein